MAAALEPLEMPEGMSIALEVTQGPFQGNIFPIRRRCVILGREQGEIRIPDPMISRRHASIEVLDKGTVLLRDLASTNGTYHNENLIAFCKLQDGDEIGMGATRLTISLDLSAD
ncbi:MAG: FHA domain-containing protein [Acidobacteriota bacterium]